MKKKDMATLVEGIRRLADDLTFIGDVLEGKEPASTQAEPEKAEAMKPEAEAADVPETEAKQEDAEPVQETPTYTFEQVRGILAEKSRSGHREQVKALIGKYGGEQLSDYKDKPDILADLVKEAEGL